MPNAGRLALICRTYSSATSHAEPGVTVPRGGGVLNAHSSGYCIFDGGNGFCASAVKDPSERPRPKAKTAPTIRLARDVISRCMCDPPQRRILFLGALRLPRRNVASFALWHSDRRLTISGSLLHA